MAGGTIGAVVFGAGCLGVGTAVGVVHQLIEVFLADLDRQYAVLEAVVVEDVGEACGDHALDAEIEQRPRRVLTAGPAAEVFPGDQDLRLAVSRLVEHEIRLLAAVLVIADFREQRFAQTRADNGLEVVLRDDLIGVDVDHR